VCLGPQWLNKKEKGIMNPRSNWGQFSKVRKSVWSIGVCGWKTGSVLEYKGRWCLFQEKFQIPYKK
jgi:hypothetical protein